MITIQESLQLANDPRSARWVAPILLGADALLCGLIIWRVPYTEIDWKAYMEQVEQFISGERDYAKIKGGTGPLVYPAAHVYIYRTLFALTDGGRDIRLAQVLFAGLYLFTLAIVMACYRQAKAPAYIFPLLVASKRLHSIFVLRCFNDCFAVMALFLSIYAYQRRMWSLGSLAYSIGLGVKMSLLLALPAVGIVLLQALGRDRAITQAMIIAQFQVFIGYPFLKVNAKSYLTRAFDLSRQFLYKWTVNWRFVPEDVFLSRTFSISLLASHAVLLALFAATRWFKPSRLSIQKAVRMALKELLDEIQYDISRRVDPQFILTSILTANAVGMLCARSLHYQFYSWIAWATPFLLWKAGFPPVLQYGHWVAQEWAWNVYPSSKASSSVVVAVLGLTVTGVWWGTRIDSDPGLGKSDEHIE